MIIGEETYKIECAFQARIAMDCGAPHGCDPQLIQQAKELFLHTAGTLGLTVDPAVIHSIFEPKASVLFPFGLLPVVARIAKTTGRHAAIGYLCELAGGRLVVPAIHEQGVAPKSSGYGCADVTARQAVDSRKNIIDCYLEARCKTGMAMREFHNKWKVEHPDAPPYSTFTRWVKKYDNGGVDALSDGRKNRPKFGPRIDARLKTRFIDLYLSRPRRSINHCVRLVNEYAADIGIDCPSPRTFSRLVGTIPHHIKILKRFGRKPRGDANR